jgi:hypothetical protein
MPDAMVTTPDMAPVVVMPDTAVPADTAPVNRDLEPGSPDLGAMRVDAPAVMPDAAVPPDVAVVPPDAAVVPPDAVVAPIDTMTVTPDVAPPPEDLAVAMPDAVIVEQDVAPPPPDASAAKLAVTPTAGDYGSIQIGTNSHLIDFTVSNTGDMASGVPLVGVTGEYYVETNSCVAPLAPQGSCVVQVKMIPSSAGTKNGTLQVSATPGGASIVPLTGYGAEPALLEVMPVNPSFPDTAPGFQSSPLTFSVKNAGGLVSGPLTISIGGTNPSNFAIANNTCSGPLLSGAVCQVTMIFAPPVGSVGSRVASLTASASPGGVASTMLLGNATYVTVTPPAYDFGDHPVTAAPKPFSFTVTHIGGTGSGHVLIMAMVNGTHAVDFRAINGCSPNGLNPGASCQVNVDFNPTNVGAKSAVLDVAAHLSTTGLTAGTDKASMTGNAVP